MLTKLLVKILKGIHAYINFIKVSLYILAHIVLIRTCMCPANTSHKQVIKHKS